MRGFGYRPIRRSRLRSGMARSSLIAALRQALRLRHYSVRTEEAYVGWVRRFVQFSEMRHPRQLGRAMSRDFSRVSPWSAEVSASTQNQALSALVFLCRRRIVGSGARRGVVVWHGHAVTRALRLRVKDVDFARNENYGAGWQGRS